MSSDTIQVAIRVRPLSEREINCGYQNIVKKTNNEPQILIGSARNSACLFTFNNVFSETDSQESVYINSVQHMIKKLFEGYNVTILAYGQTGSGKTYTMDTNYNGIPSESMGVIPRAVLDIFDNVANMKVEHDITIKCSFVELYNEHLFDLLSNATNRNDCIVDIREDAAKGIIIPGLTETEVNTIEEIISCLVKGSGGRAVGATAMNETSSRSHAIFTITIELTKKDNPRIKTSSRFHLVDLAGSERSKKTKATGNRLKEGIKINQGLFALGKCITALGGPNPNSFVPYRESKLTRLLQDSLGGNSVTLLIACVSPADSNMDETLNTLNYANRAKNIKNKPIINHDPEAVELENWEKKAQALRLEILNLENISCLPVDNDGNISIIEMESISILNTELKEAQRQNQDFQIQFRNAMTGLLNVEVKNDLIEKTYNELNEIVDKIIDTINRVMEKEFSESCHHSLAFMQKTQTIVKEMKSLLTSIITGVINFTEHVDNEKSTGSKDDNENESILMNGHDNSANNVDYDDMNIEGFQKKQLGFTNELQQLNKQIAIKEELHRQICSNLPSFLFDNSRIHEKINELEKKVKTLESERIDLDSQLLLVEKTNTALNKVADERVNKIDILEKKLESLKKQQKQQEKLVELKEADSQRIKQLLIEITELKSTRVRILREMKKCSELHKKWTYNKNLEINKIRSLARKRKCEMARMSINNKQRQNVLKRRIAEAFAGIKNLELKIEKKRSAQLSRRRGNLGKAGCIKSEIDVILAITETEVSFDHIKQNREQLISVIEMLKQETPLRTIEIDATEKQLKQLNKQIASYHSTIISSRKDDKIKKLVDETGSIEDQREVVKYLFSEKVNLSKELSERNSEFNMIKKLNEIKLNKVGLLETKQANIKQKFLSDLHSIERRNEEKIGQLLRETQLDDQQLQPGNTSNRDKLMDEARKKKLEYLKVQSDLEYENEELLKELNYLNEQAEKANQISMYDEDYYNENEVDMFNEDDVIHDPDWNIEEELVITRNRSHNNNHSNTNNTLDGLKKRKISTDEIKCRCTKTCSKNKTCKCRKNEAKCNDKCKCNKSCSNRGGVEEEQNSDVSGENNKNSLNVSNEDDTGTHTDFISDASTPKKQKLTTNIMDVTTPCYPYAKKERTPFYTME